jgi:hypothetical protein
MVDLRAWGASEVSSPAVDEREHLSKGFLCGMGMVQSLSLGQQVKNIFEETSYRDGCYMLPDGI